MILEIISSLKVKQILYHNLLFAFCYFRIQFQVSCNSHCFLNRQISVQLIILHDISAQFPELTNISLFSIDFNVSFFDVCGPKAQKVWFYSVNLRFA